MFEIGEIKGLLSGIFRPWWRDVCLCLVSHLVRYLNAKEPRGSVSWVASGSLALFRVGGLLHCPCSFRSSWRAHLRTARGSWMRFLYAALEVAWGGLWTGRGDAASPARRGLCGLAASSRDVFSLTPPFYVLTLRDGFSLSTPCPATEVGMQ